MPSSAIADAKLRLLRGASNILHAQGSSCNYVALLCLVVLTLKNKGAGVAANALVEQLRITQVLVSSLFCAGSTGAGACQAASLEAIALGALQRLVCVHGASPSSVLLRCGVDLGRLIGRLTDRGGVHQQVSLALCELFATLCEDPALATKICCPRVLEAMKSPLLSGQVHVQLAAVDVLAKIQRHAEGGTQVLCAEDMVSFLLEVLRAPPAMSPGVPMASQHGYRSGSGGSSCFGGPRAAGGHLNVVVPDGREPTSKKDERSLKLQGAHLRTVVIELLTELLQVPQRHSSSLLARAVCALQQLRRGGEQDARRQLLFPGMRDSRMHFEALNMECLSQPLRARDRVSALNEFHDNARCAAAVLGWYTPQAADVLPLVLFCRDGARVMSSVSVEASGCTLPQGIVDGRGTDELRRQLEDATAQHRMTRTLTFLSDLLAAAFRGGATDATTCAQVLHLCDSQTLPLSLQSLVEFAGPAASCSDSYRASSLGAVDGFDVARDQPRSEAISSHTSENSAASLGTELVRSTVELFARLLGESALDSEIRRSFAIKHSRDCLWLLNLASQPDLGPSASRLVIALLSALGRLPIAPVHPEGDGHHTASLAAEDAPHTFSVAAAARAPRDLASCISELQIVRHDVSLYAIELLLLILEHIPPELTLDGGRGQQDGHAGEAARQVQAGRTALRMVARTHHGSLHTKIPAATLRRLAACWLPLLLDRTAVSLDIHLHSDASHELAFDSLTDALLHCAPGDLLQCWSCVSWMVRCSMWPRAPGMTHLAPWMISEPSDGREDGACEDAIARMVLDCALECYGPASSIADSSSELRHMRLDSGDGQLMRGNLIRGLLECGGLAGHMLVSLLSSHLQAASPATHGVSVLLALLHAFAFASHSPVPKESEHADVAEAVDADTAGRLVALLSAGLISTIGRLFLCPNLETEAVGLAFRLLASCYVQVEMREDLISHKTSLSHAFHHAVQLGSRLLCSPSCRAEPATGTGGERPSPSCERDSERIWSELLNLFNVALTACRDDGAHAVITGSRELLQFVSTLALAPVVGQESSNMRLYSQEDVRVRALALLVQVLDASVHAQERQGILGVLEMNADVMSLLNDRTLSLSNIFAAVPLTQVLLLPALLPAPHPHAALAV